MLARDPADPAALALLQRLTTALAAPARPPEPHDRADEPLTGFDWTRAEEEVAGAVEAVLAEPRPGAPVVRTSSGPFCASTTSAGWTR